MLEQAKHGDASALGWLLENYRGRLRTAAAALIGPSSRPGIDPSDIVQETYLRASRDFPNFRGREEWELLAWLRKILARCLADQFKHQARLIRNPARREAPPATSPPPDALAARDPSPSECAVRREQVALLAEAVARLPADQRMVYRLRVAQQLSFDEIAPLMGRSVGAVRMLWLRSLRSLGAMLEERS